MWARAAPSGSTTAAEMSADRYSVPQSVEVAATTSSLYARTLGSPCTVTPARASSSSTSGRNESAMSACTSSDSAVLQVDRRWVLEFSTTASAFSRSAAASTYTWQLPTPVSITGTVDSSTTV